jgi:hypothetical protein
MDNLFSQIRLLLLGFKNCGSYWIQSRHINFPNFKEETTLQVAILTEYLERR